MLRTDYVAMANSVLEDKFSVGYVVEISGGVKEKYNGIEYICANVVFTSRNWKNLVNDLINSAYHTGGTATAHFNNGDTVSVTRDWVLGAVWMSIKRQNRAIVVKWIDCETLAEVDRKFGYIGR